MQGNVLGQTVGNLTRLNIFTQPNEPNKKDGIWIKTDEPYKYEKVQIIENYEFVNGIYEKLQDIPISYGFHNGSAVAIGTDIYLLGYNMTNYKYDTLANSYTRLQDIPYNFSDGSAVAIGTDIYLLGSDDNDYNTNNYKYRVITNTTNKTIVIQINNRGAKLIFNKIYEIYFSGAKIYDNYDLQDYPVYYGNGTEWVEIN